MTSVVAPLERKYGTVKWFGGHNKKTGRENNFGFIKDLSGKEVFLHREQWQGKRPPAEAEVVTYLEEESGGKFSARAAESLKAAKLSAADLYAALCAPPLNAGRQSELMSAAEVKKVVREKLCEGFRDTEPGELSLLVHRSQEPGMPSLFSLVADRSDAAQNYGCLLRASGLRIGDDAPWAALSKDVAIHFETELAAHLENLEPEAVRAKLASHLLILPASLLTHLLVRGVFTTTDQLGKGSERVYEYLSAVTIKKTAAFPEYLKTSFETDTAKNAGLPSNPILYYIVENFRFKKSLFDRGTEFIDIYQNSKRLSRNVETFILYNLFSLIAAGNAREIVYGVFLQRLWEALTSKLLPLEQRRTRLHALFPPCGTIGQALSCEAVHWPKQNLFLCRSKACSYPRVLPNPSHHFMDFNIYDWLGHYGVDYMVSGKPQAKDFPIKLASYFNRLQELLPVLHCRVCDDLMLPNMKYARTQYKEQVHAAVVIKEMAAAYRLTVFHCNNDRCCEYNIGYYISHCVGFGCYHIIDSRDLKQRCSSGLYICNGCGSCCSDHANSHPAGLCAECGSELKVESERVRGNKARHLRKHVRCTSPSCRFTIGPADLPAKFNRMPAKSEAQIVATDESHDPD
jgi:cold shock CspA family protein